MRKAFWAQTVCCAAHIPKEALMRIPALAILTIATVLTAAPVRAQTYDPAYPVCLHVYQQWGSHYYDCSYTSLPQCNGPRGTVLHQSIFRERASARGLSAASPPLLSLCPRARKPPSLTGPETSAEMCSRCASAKGPFKILSADMRWKGWSILLRTPHRSAGAPGAIPIVMIR